MDVAHAYPGCSNDPKLRFKPWYSWTTAGCDIRAKIHYETGHVACVDHPSPNNGRGWNTKLNLQDSTLNFFKVAWSDRAVSPGEMEDPAHAEGAPTPESCAAAAPHCYPVEDGCMWEAFVGAREIAEGGILS